MVAPTGTGRCLRRITWRDPDSGEVWSYLTNEPERNGDSRRQMKLPPGLIVLLYRRRWNLEPERSGDSWPSDAESCQQKVYDQFKNKLNEPERSGDSQPPSLIICWHQKSWASSVTAKAAQAGC